MLFSPKAKPWYQVPNGQAGYLRLQFFVYSLQGLRVLTWDDGFKFLDLWTCFAEGDALWGKEGLGKTTGVDL